VRVDLIVLRYELHDEGGRRLWQIALQGATFRTRYSTHGGDESVATRYFDNVADADVAHRRRIAEKVRDGYRRAGDAVAFEGKPPPVSLALERAIVERRDDERARVAYAEWLKAHGESGVHLPPDVLGLRFRGELVDEIRVVHSWRSGFAGGYWLGRCLAQPFGRLVRSLRSDGTNREDYAALLEALDEHRPPALRAITLFGEDRGVGEEGSDLGDLELLCDPRAATTSAGARALSSRSIDLFVGESPGATARAARCRDGNV
jgi:uncharacterized protein (TIGR02996 family)